MQISHHEAFAWRATSAQVGPRSCGCRGMTGLLRRALTTPGSEQAPSTRLGLETTSQPASSKGTAHTSLPLALRAVEHESRASSCAESRTLARGPPGKGARATGVRSKVDAVAGALGKLAKRRQTRRATAKEKLAEAVPAHDEGEQSFLCQRSVSVPTLTRYREEVAAITMWSHGEGLGALRVTNMPKLDAQVTEYLNALYFDGEGLSRGTYVVSAVLHTWPDLARSTQRPLPLCRQALKGWRNLAPPQSRLPLPWDIVAAIAHELATELSPRMSLLTVLVFHSYMRPGVAHKLRMDQLTPPVPCGQGPQALWTLNLHPQELEQPSKTGAWDETLPLADVAGWEWLAQALTLVIGRGAQHVLGRHGETLADRPLADWTAAFLRIATRLGVPLETRAVLYRLRHGGASHDVALQLRSLAEVRKRGCWRSDSSVARYAKPARLNQQLLALGEQNLTQVQALAAACPTTLLRALSENSCGDGCRSSALVQAEVSTPGSSSMSSRGRSG